METLARDRHIAYVHSLSTDTNTFEYHATEHLRVSGIYWSLSAMKLLKAEDEMDRDGIVEFVKSCQDPETGGFGGGPDHDPHLLYTLSALQVLEIIGRRDAIDRPAARRFVSSLQLPDGSFAGDQWGEVDTRFSYCAIQCALLLAPEDDANFEGGGKKDGGGDDARGKPNRTWIINTESAAEHISRCRNFDGAFGTSPGAESHAGQVFCCVGSLALLSRLDLLDRDLLSWWLCERQLPCGGLNGRPEKKEDVCYSWWVLSSLCAMRRDSWIDGKALAKFIRKCEDREDGGFADRPGDVADVFHTFFALAGLSMLGDLGEDSQKIDPVTALPIEVAEDLQRRWGKEW